MRIRVEENLVPTLKPHRQHLDNSADLTTPYEAIRAGFVALALERNRRATPVVAEARALKVAASKAATVSDLLGIKALRPALLTAAGVSDKAANNMLSEDHDEAIKGLVAKYLEPAGTNFVEELVFRFLLTRGDTLGGSMRNVGGVLAKRKLARATMGALTLTKTPYYRLDSKVRKWTLVEGDDTDLELYMKGISWSTGKQNRTILFDIQVPLIANNVDLCFFNCAYSEVSKAIKDPTLYIALGELKGGIDPAGADEHWKTARSALKRIRDAFARRKLRPYTLFIGAAIASKMADELWAELESGTLSNAANLTNESQVASICQWLIQLGLRK